MATYFISYSYFTPKGANGFGNIAIERSYPIAGPGDVSELTETITEAMRRELKVETVHVAILNFREFEPDIQREPTGERSIDNVVLLRPR